MSENQVEMEEPLNTEGITSTEVLGRVNALVKLQEEVEVLNDQMEKEILEIEKKYLAKFQPLNQKRSEIVSGKVEPSKDEQAAKEPITVDNLSSVPAEKGIPKFWLHTLKNTSIGEMIDEVDMEALSHLVDIKVTPIGDDSDFSLDFIFSENPFFTNTTISKIVHVKDGQLENIESTPINWKDGKNFTVKSVKKQVRAKGKGKSSTVTTKTAEEPVDCFFGLFLTSFEADAEDEEADQIMFIQYQTISKLKEVIVPNAIDFFLGRADDNEEGDFDGFGDFDGEDFEGEDFDEEGEEEDDQVIRTKGSKGGKPAPPNDPNCKQQ